MEEYHGLKNLAVNFIPENVTESSILPDLKIFFAHLDFLYLSYGVKCAEKIVQTDTASTDTTTDTNPVILY